MSTVGHVPTDSPGRTALNEDAPLQRSLVRWQLAGVLVFVLLVAAFPLYKAVEGTRRTNALSARDTALKTSGRQLWVADCSSCHGQRGQGVDAPALNSKQFLTGVTDDQMHGIIASGIPGTAMPTWLNEFGGPLTDDQIDAVIAYVRSWEKTAPSNPNWRSPGGTMPGG